MPDTKISGLASLGGSALAAGDLFTVVDVSDTAMAASGTNKQMSRDELAIGLQTPRHAIKTADQTSTDNVNFVDVTDLTWPIVANGVYIVEFVLFALAAATTTGLSITLNGPAIGTGYLRYGFEAPTSATARWQGGASTYGTALTATGVPSTTVAYIHRVAGYLANGANAGTLALRMRSEVSASGVTIQRGSWGSLTRTG